MVLLNVPADPTISLSVQFAVGSQNDPPGKEGLAFLTGEMLADAATEMRSLDEILAALYPLAASYGMRVDIERTTLTGRVHRDNLAAFLELYHRRVLEAGVRRGRLRARAQRRDQRDREHAALLVRRGARQGGAARPGVSRHALRALERRHRRGLALDHARRRARVLSPLFHARERGCRHRRGLRRGGRRTARSGRAAVAGRLRRRRRRRSTPNRSTAAPRWSSTSPARMPRSASAFRSTCAAATATSMRCGSRTRGSASTAISRAICST